MNILEKYKLNELDILNILTNLLYQNKLPKDLFGNWGNYNFNKEICNITLTRTNPQWETIKHYNIYQIAIISDNSYDSNDVNYIDMKPLLEKMEKYNILNLECSN